MNTISAVVLTKNEEETIEECIKSLLWCDEIIVIDDDSNDKTVTLAENNGAKVIPRKISGDFSTQRNYALEKAKNDWVLFIDADEKVSKELAEEIQQKINKTNANGFYIKRVDVMWGKKLQYGEAGNMALLRLGKKDAGKWIGSVHETWETSGEKDVLNNTISHYPHKNITEFLEKINFYTTLRAQELFNAKVTTNYFLVVAYPIGKFVQNYFIKLGILDGTAGFVHAMLMSLHSFLVRGKLWLLWNKK